MKLIVGTYRKQAYIGRALKSIDKHLTGVSEIIFVDDSGDPEHSEWLRQYGDVREVGGKGYGPAMQTVCEVGRGAEAMFLEEDFEFIEDVSLDHLSEILFYRPSLAQIALLRGPWFPIEHEHGGLLEALVAKGHDMLKVGDVWHQKATFTCNPSVWRASVFDSGWPQGRWSEELKRDQLLRAGYEFGFLEGVKVNHDGERSGTGY